MTAAWAVAPIHPAGRRNPPTSVTITADEAVALGVGIGQLAAVLLRAAFQGALGRLRAHADSGRGRQAVVVADAAECDIAAAPVPARVSTLPMRPAASLAPLRGRHAA